MFVCFRTWRKERVTRSLWASRSSESDRASSNLSKRWIMDLNLHLFGSVSSRLLIVACDGDFRIFWKAGTFGMLYKSFSRSSSRQSKSMPRPLLPRRRWSLSIKQPIPVKRRRARASRPTILQRVTENPRLHPSVTETSQDSSRVWWGKVRWTHIRRRNYFQTRWIFFISITSYSVFKVHCTQKMLGLILKLHYNWPGPSIWITQLYENNKLSMMHVYQL